MKKRTYYCGRCRYFLIAPNHPDREKGKCYGLRQTTVLAKQKACKHYRPKNLKTEPHAKQS